MRPHTSNFEEEIKLQGRKQSVQITFNDTSLAEESINSVSYSFEGALLKSVMQSLVIDSNVEIPKNTELNFKYGLSINEEYEYLDYGQFIVKECTKKEDTNSYEIKAYDKLLWSMKDYEAVNIKYPCSLDAYLQALCKKLGYTLGTTQYANMTKSIDRDFFTGINYTYRDALDDIAEVTASTIYIKDTTLYLGQPQESDITLDARSFKDTNVNFGEIYGPVNSIVLSRSASSDNVYLRDEDSVAKDGLCELKIVDNQIMNLNNRSEYLTEILQQLNGTYYSINDFTSTGIMYLELLDYYNVQIGDNEYKCLMLNDEQDITQGLTEQIHTERPEEAETDYKKADKTDQKINQTYLIVDKQNQTINALISSNADTVQKVNQLDASVDQLSSKISETADVTTSADGYGKIEVANVNASEPIMIKIHSTGVPIQALYPRNKLYPSANLYPHKKEIKFIRKDENGNATNEFIYDLPANLYWYNSEIYDEFILDYEKQKCYILRRTEYNADTGKVTSLGTTVEEEYDYPTIALQDGDYTVIMPAFETAYIYVKLMGKNIYTTQFATHVELNSAMNQTKNSITASVQETLTNYVTNTDLKAELELKIDKNDNSQIVSMINASANEINLKSNRLTIESDYFTLTKEGMITAVSGNIGGFDITSTNLNKEISGIYDYNEFDYCITAGLITKNINQEANLVNIMDINNDNKVSASDYTIIKNIVNGISENTKIQSGKMTIDSTNVKKAIAITDSNYSTTVSLGINGVETTLLNSSNIICGSAINTFTGFMLNGSEGTMNMVEGNNVKAKIKASGEISCVNLTQTSLVTEKKNFNKYKKNAVDIIKAIDIYNYNLKNENTTDKKHIGFVIGDKYNYSREITNNENNGVDLYSFISLCCKAIQEQQEEIETLKKRCKNGRINY